MNGTKGPPTPNLIGKRFGRLVVEEKSPEKGHAAFWICKCDCGNYTDVASTKLIQGTTQSCGCQLKKAREKWKSIYKDEKIQEKIKHTFRQNDGREKGTKLSILKLATVTENRELKERVRKLSGLIETFNLSSREQVTNNNSLTENNSMHSEDKNNKEEKIVESNNRQGKIHKNKTNKRWWHFW